MALTRKMLKAMGIEDEKIDQIIEEHVNVTDSLKEERDRYKADAEKLPDLQKKLENATKNGGEETVSKAEHDKLQKEYDDYKAEQTAKETRAAKERAVREFYKSTVGISEKRLDTVMKVTNLDEIELDKDGKIKDADKRAETAKTEWADFIPQTKTTGAKTANPPAGTGGGGIKTRAEIEAIKDPSERRIEIAKAISADPNFFKSNKGE